MRLHSSVFVETGVLDGPLQNEKFAQNFVNEITNSYKNSNQIIFSTTEKNLEIKKFY